MSRTTLAMVWLLSLAVGFGCSSSDGAGGDGNGGDGDSAGDNKAGGPMSDLTGSSNLTPGVSDGPGGAANVTGDPRIAPFIASPCDKVDIVFAVDGSQSMTEELEAMRETVFPAFAQRLRQVGAGVDDFRVGVLDACPRPSNLHARGRAGACNFFGGNPWVESASDEFNAEIACVGDLYQADRSCSGNNDDEQPASAIAAALENAEPGDDNEGFLRGDSLLIAIAITDEDEQPTQGGRNARDVYERLVEVAGGDPRYMVFLGIGGGSQCIGPYGEAENARTLKGITDLFAQSARGVFWDLCDGRLEDGLSEAFRVIDRACNDLPPPRKPPSPPTEPPTTDEPCGGLDVTCTDTDIPNPDYGDAGSPI